MSRRLITAHLVLFAVAGLLTAFVAGTNHQRTKDADEAAAVCTTDADCARWEEAQNVPHWFRTYGAPTPKPHPCSENQTPNR